MTKEQGITVGESVYANDLNACLTECRDNDECKSLIYCNDNFCELKDKTIDDLYKEPILYNCTVNKDCPKNCTSYSQTCSSRKYLNPS